MLVYLGNTFVQVKGGGASRLVQLHPRCVFVMDMAKLVGSNPGGLLISKVVPSYKEMFGKDLNVSHLGYNKLIRALESMPNVVEVSGGCVELAQPVKKATCAVYL